MAPERRPFRPGVSLIEVLVVISILSFMLALLMPAVQNVRAAAARSICQSHLRQLALASLNYEATHGRLPPAFQHRHTKTPYPNLQWSILISPYLDQDNLWRMTDEDFRKQPDAILPTPHRAMSIPIQVLGCPSDPRLERAWEVSFLYTLAVPKPVPVKVTVALKSYLGNSGDVTKKRNGVILADGRVTVVNIEDGTSNTLLYGERPPSENLLFGETYIGWGPKASSDGEFDAVMGVKDLNPWFKPDSPCGPGPFPFRQPDLANQKPNYDCAMFQYWSYHDGGANFAFGDGSVRFLSYNVDSILAALATRAGQEIVSIP